MRPHRAARKRSGSRPRRTNHEVQAQRESAELRKEATSVGAELQRTKIIVKEQEEGLAASRRSLAEAAADAAAIRARFGPACRLKASKAGEKKARTPGTGATATATATAADSVTGDGRRAASWSTQVRGGRMGIGPGLLIGGVIGLCQAFEGGIYH
eukprot:g7700.t1